MKGNKLKAGFLVTLIAVMASCASQSDYIDDDDTQENNPVLASQVATPTDLATKRSSFAPNYSQPAADARLALSHGDVALWTESRRGVGIIGYVEQDSHAVEQYCGLKYLPQSSDILAARENISWQKVREYANRYNQVVLPACQRAIAKAGK